MMRRILVDHARSRHYAKRGGGARQVSLDVSPGTVMRDWTLAKAWLRREISSAIGTRADRFPTQTENVRPAQAFPYQ